MNKYSFIANSEIKKKKRSNKKKLDIKKEEKLSFLIKVPSMGFISEKRDSLKRRIKEIIKQLEELKRTPKNSIFLCNSGTIGFLRTYYGYSGSAANPLPLFDYKIVVDDNISNNYLIIEKKK